MINEKNIYDRGTLVSLKMGRFEGRMKLPEEFMKDLPTEIVRGVNDIFDERYKMLLTDIRSHDGMTRILLSKMAVSFPLPGVWFVLSTKLADVVELLDTRQAERTGLILKAVEEYDNAVFEFAQKYPDYYRIAFAKGKYITRDDLKYRFYFRYQFIKIAAPDKDSAFITPELYKAEMKKFRETIEEMKREVLSTIYTELLKRTALIREQCEDSTPNQKTINNLNSFLNQIDEIYSDFIDRDDMKQAIKNIRAKVLGIEAEDLRNDIDLKKKFNEEIKEVAETIKSMPDIPLKRSMDF